MIDIEGFTLWTRRCLDFLRDLGHGRYFGGHLKTRYGHLGAHDTSSSYYFVISRMFSKYPARESDVLVDVGCGKGRVIDWWLRQGYTNRIVGIELDEIIAAETAKRFAGHRNVTIICGNASDAVPEDGTLFYLYNPFNGTVMEAFKERLKRVCKRPHDVRIYYVNCAFLDAFCGDPYWKVCTNLDRFGEDPAWTVRGLDFGISYPVAIVMPAGQERISFQN